MSMNTELLQFLDGTISPDAEAELLHRLSVSPERRDLLRSFINQQVLFQRDRNSIAVPYAAEQKLWARLGEIMPPVLQNAATPAAVETAATAVTRTRMFSSVFTAASVAVICLLVGLGSGYFVGKNSGNTTIASGQFIQSPVQALSSQTPIESTHNRTNSIHSSRQHTFASTENTIAANSGAPLDMNSAPTSSIPGAGMIGNADESKPGLPHISTIDPKHGIMDNPINTNLDGYYAHSPFDGDEALPHKSFLQRWEFSFNEGIGKQYPNNAATNVSMPVVTNSSIAAFFQPWDNARNILHSIWFGANFGTANVTQKKFSIVQKNATDPKQGYEMAADLVHVQTSYVGALLEYRIPVSAKVAIPINAMVAPSSAGTIYGFELGAHYEATNNFGIIAGVRGTYLSYNLDAQQQQVIAQGATAFGIPAPVASQAKQQSYNLEISSGIYFHF
jgi:hypothetical protein